MDEHLLHYILLVALVATIFFIKKGTSAFIISLLCLFTLIHGLPAVLVLTHNHLSHTQSVNHECCIPQNLVMTSDFIFDQPDPNYVEVMFQPKISVFQRFSSPLNTRSPPVIFS